MKLLMLGFSGNAIEIVNMLPDLSDTDGTRYDPLGFLDDNPARQDTAYDSIPVLGGIESAKGYLSDPEVRFVNATGSPSSYAFRSRVTEKAGIPAERYATLIHASAVVFRSANIGRGVVLFPNVTVTSHAVVENHVLVLANCVLNHDTRIGDHTCITTSVTLAGGVEIGRSCYIGSGAAIRENTQIGAGSLIGIGSVVLRDVEPNTVVVGNPARFLRPAEHPVSSSG